jgi:hypothetical protein
MSSTGAKAGRWARSTALPIAAGLVALAGVVVVATRDVQETGAGFTDAASGGLALQSGVVAITPGSPVGVPFSATLGPGESEELVLTLENESTVDVPHPCVVLDILPERALGFSEALGSVIDVVVERKPGTAAEGGAWVNLYTGNLLGLAPSTAPTFGNGAETSPVPIADNGEAVTYRFTFSMGAGVGGTVSHNGTPTDITDDTAGVTFGFVAESVTSGGCAGAVSA